MWSKYSPNIPLSRTLGAFQFHSSDKSNQEGNFHTSYRRRNSYLRWKFLCKKTKKISICRSKFTTKQRSFTSVLKALLIPKTTYGGHGIGSTVPFPQKYPLTQSSQSSTRTFPVLFEKDPAGQGWSIKSPVPMEAEKKISFINVRISTNAKLIKIQNKQNKCFKGNFFKTWFFLSFILSVVVIATEDFLSR